MGGRNGGQLNRGIEFLRNFYKNGINNTETSDSTEYRKLQTKKESTATQQQQQQQHKDEPNEMTMVGIEDNVGAIKRQNLSNGFVVSDKN